MTSAMTSHFGPVNVDFLKSGRTNLKSVSHDMVLSYIFFFQQKADDFFSSEERVLKRSFNQF